MTLQQIAMNPTGWAGAGPTFNPLQASQLGIQAARAGAQEARTQEAFQMEKEERQASKADEMAIRAKSQEAMALWKANDRAGLRQALGELATMDQKAAQGIGQIFGTLDFQSFGESSYNLLSAQAISDYEGQNKLIDNAIDIISGANPNHPFIAQLQQIRAMPEGEERTLAIQEGIEFAKTLGVPFGGEAGGGEPTKYQTGKGYIERQGEKTFYVKPVFDPSKGDYTLKKKEITGEILSEMGETPEEIKNRKVAEAGEKKAVEQAVKTSGEFAERYSTVQEGIATLDNAINEVQDAIVNNKFLGTGPIEKYLPKWTEASARFENIASNLGLQIIAGGKFGPLSEGEMKLAMATAIPPNLDDKQLLKWLQDKRQAQLKLGEYLAGAATFIGSPKPEAEGGGVYTVRDWTAKQPKIGGTDKKKEADKIFEGF